MYDREINRKNCKLNRIAETCTVLRGCGVCNNWKHNDINCYTCKNYKNTCKKCNWHPGENVGKYRIQL